MTIGSGRILYQSLVKIDKAIDSGKLASNPALKELLAKCQRIHIIGLYSDGGVHSHLRHFDALIDIVKSAGAKPIIHAITDGRDVVPTTGVHFIEHLSKENKIASICGRFYAMDRDKRWDRVEKAYNNIVLADGQRFTTSDEAISASYKNGVTDEFVIPAVIGDYQGAKDGDVVLMITFRADRAREILYALGDKEFNGFERKRIVKFAELVGMVEYSVDHNRFMKTIFAPEALKNIFGEVIANHGLTQLRIAETEKYAHVTFFFNGGEEKEFKGEDRILINSPKVATYDLKPEMSVYEVTDALTQAIKQQKYDVIICNFANGDMVGHTGIMDAALKAVAAVDDCLGKVLSAIKDVDGVLIVTADHGNVEKMVDEKTGEPYTAHTVGKVQAVLYNAKTPIKSLKDGRLADIAPTLLDLMQIEKPQEMTGNSLIIK